ncbi:IS110 family transposase [Streptomyces sp. TRM72054]|nr:IS110 family transposase [Streptomyces sp. TRM72054]
MIDTDDHVLSTEAFSTTRGGYRALLAWMRTFGDVRRIGSKAPVPMAPGSCATCNWQASRYWRSTGPTAPTGAIGARTTPDADNAAHAALAGNRVITPKTHTGMVESLRVLRIARSTAVKARRVALQMLRCQIISAPEELRDQVRNLTQMQHVRTCAAWRPDETAFRDPVSATRITIKSLTRRYPELNDEVADLDTMIEPLVRELAPSLLERSGFGIENTAQLLVTCGDNPQRVTDEARFAKLCGVAPLPPPPGRSSVTGSTAVATRPTPLSTWPWSAACITRKPPRSTSNTAPAKASRRWRSSVVSNGTSPTRRTTCSSRTAP